MPTTEAPAAIPASAPGGSVYGDGSSGRTVTVTVTVTYGVAGLPMLGLSRMREGVEGAEEVEGVDVVDPAGSVVAVITMLSLGNSVNYTAVSSRGTEMLKYDELNKMDVPEP
ncbi:hypothetical protein HIM_06248 [Hirsutella minnesotensis 3608]|uniref:Uncharacterized protein n=1 Tax=Hirsutella minnesotensis 3608 TaxID=1043627 RepID=A0A0F7ZU88_9HYPO|nr:hypothetical protein HIM_06248 [Hirsutella minnesotensis 3608]